MIRSTSRARYLQLVSVSQFFPFCRNLSTCRLPGVTSCGLTVDPSKIYLLPRCFSSSNPVYKEAEDAPAPPAPNFTRSLDRRRSRAVSDTPLIQQLHNFHSVDDVLDFVEVSIGELDGKAVCAIASRLNDLIRKGLPDFDKTQNKSVWTTVGMQKFSRALKKHCRFMDAADLVTVIKLMVFMNVPGSNTTMQSVLRLASKHVNLMAIPHIMYLHALLDHHIKPENKSPLSEALVMALPVVFETQIQVQLDRSDANDLVDYLSYATHNKLSDSTFQKLFGAAADKIGDMNAFQLLRFINSTVDHPRYLPENAHVIAAMFDRMSALAGQLNAGSTVMLLRKCRRFERRFHTLHVDAIQSAIDNIVNLNDKRAILESMSHISRLRFVHVEYMEKLTDLFLSEPSLLLNSESMFFDAIKLYSGTSYRPDNWEKLAPLLLEHPVVLKMQYTIEIPTALDLLAINVFPQRLIEKIFSESNVPMLDEWIARHSSHSLLIIYGAVKNLYPDYSGPLPSEDLVNKWLDSMMESYRRLASATNMPFKTAVASACGGEDYVADQILMNTTVVDHVVLIRKDGSPVVIADLDFPAIQKHAEVENATIVLVKTYGREAFASNTRRLRGIYNLEYRVIESHSYPCMRVSWKEWKEMDEFDKAHFFKSQISELTGSHLRPEASNSEVI